MFAVRLIAQLRRMFGGPWSIRFILSALSLQALVLLALALIFLSWHSSKQGLLEAARSTAQQNSRIIALQLAHDLDAASTLLRVFGLGSQATAHSSDDWQERLPLLTRELHKSPFLSAIYRGNQQGGFVSLRSLQRAELRQQLKAPAKARYLVQEIQPNQTPPGSYRFYDEHLQLLENRSMPDYRFDPRQRDWYQQAQGSNEVQATAPYLFFSTGQLGISLSIASPNGREVLGLDLALDDLSQKLQQLVITPGTELAIVDQSGTLLAYPSAQQVLAAQDDNQLSIQHLRQLGIQPLTHIFDHADSTAQDEEWLALSFALSDHLPFYLLAATPTDKVLAGAYQARNRQLIWAGALSLLLFCFSYGISGFIGGRMLKLLSRVQRITRFDFSAQPRVNSLVKESNRLEEIVDTVSQTLQHFLAISQIVATERNTQNMLQQVLQHCVAATGSQAGLVYLWQEQPQQLQLAAYHGLTPSTAQHCPTEQDPDYWELNQRPELAPLQQFTFSLKGRQGELVGTLALLRNGFGHNRQEKLRFYSFVEQLSGMLAVTVETHALLDSQRQLLDGIIRMLAGAIDAKSPYTSGHCQRVPALATMLADQLQEQTEGPWAEFQLDAQQRHAFFLAAWLHDCGKLATPEHIIDKPSKLDATYNRLHEVRMRFEVLWRDAQLQHAQSLAEGLDAEQADLQLQQRQQQLHDDFAFVARCNLGEPSLTPSDQERLAQIAQQQWQRHFDDLIGLGPAELQLRLHNRPAGQQLPCSESLLQDLPCHLIGWQGHAPAVEPQDPRNKLKIDMQLPEFRHNLGELHNLSVERGTLTQEDRFIVNNHIVQTLVMLSDLPWPKGLQEVPDIAANHHERMDGQGYPRKLPAGELPVTHRILALADVFEALTARDRPYKKGKTLSQSFELMLDMCAGGHLDPQLMHFFVQSQVWADYAERFLAAEQIDQPDLAQLLTRLESLF